MKWYDLFSRVYDASLERLYLEPRAAAAEALQLQPGDTVLDLPCGTGQSFDTVRDGIGPSGTILGVDYSQGMLDRAAARVARHGWDNVHLVQADVRTLGQADLDGAAGRPASVDRLLIFLGLSVFPDWEDAFDNLWGLLQPGGRCVVVDVHTDRLTPLGRMQNLFTQADITRRFWEPLQRRAPDMERRRQPALQEHGGEVWLACGTKR